MNARAGHLPDYTLESNHSGPVAGVDEAGRGPWAGPVVVAAAILAPHRMPAGLLNLIDDSKRLRPDARDEVAQALRGLREGFWFALAAASVAEIDRYNILHATERAMTRAVNALPVAPAHVLVDGNRLGVAVTDEPISGREAGQAPCVVVHVRLKPAQDDQILPMPVERLKMRTETGTLKRPAVPVGHPLVEGPALRAVNHQEAEWRLRLRARAGV